MSLVRAQLGEFTPVSIDTGVFLFAVVLICFSVVRLEPPEQRLCRIAVWGGCMVFASLSREEPPGSSCGDRPFGSGPVSFDVFFSFSSDA